MRELTTRELSAVKRVFENSLPALKKIETIDRKIAELQKERDLQMSIIEGGEQGIKRMTGGYRSIDLISCEYVPQFNEDGTPKMDKDGKYQIKKRVLTFHAPVEPEVLPENTQVDDAPNGEVETAANEAPFNPIEGLE